MKEKIDLQNLDKWHAMSLARRVRDLTGKHCVEVRTCRTFGDGYWAYYLTSHDMSEKDLQAVIKLLVSVFYS